jgi:hypothetical protein
MSWKRRTCTNTDNLPVSSLLLVNVTQVTGSTKACSLIKQGTAVAVQQVVYTLRTGDLSVWSINIIRFVHWYHMAKYTRRGNAITVSRQIFDKAPSHLNNSRRISFPGVNRPGRGVDHSLHPPPTLKKEYSYLPSGSSWPVQGWIYFTLSEYVRLRKSYSLAFRKNVHFRETSAKLDTYKNAARIDSIICVSVDMDTSYTRVLHKKSRTAYLTNDVTPFTSHGRCYVRA